jgi:hypothetical protein
MTNMTYSVTITADSGMLAATVTGEDPKAVSQAVRDWAIATYGGTQPVRKSVVEVPLAGEGAPTEDAPICAVHQQPMVLQPGRHGTFWSCHARNANGSLCNYRPTQAAA